MVVLYDCLFMLGNYCVVFGILFGDCVDEVLWLYFGVIVEEVKCLVIVLVGDLFIVYSIWCWMDLYWYIGG